MMDARKRATAMKRFTISLDGELARQFDEFIAGKGYGNRSEAARDLIHARQAFQTSGHLVRGELEALRRGCRNSGERGT